MKLMNTLKTHTLSNRFFLTFLTSQLVALSICATTLVPLVTPRAVESAKITKTFSGEMGYAPFVKILWFMMSANFGLMIYILYSEDIAKLGILKIGNSQREEEVLLTADLNKQHLNPASIPASLPPSSLPKTDVSKYYRVQPTELMEQMLFGVEKALPEPLTEELLQIFSLSLLRQNYKTQSEKLVFIEDVVQVFNQNPKEVKSSFDQLKELGYGISDFHEGRPAFWASDIQQVVQKAVKGD